MGRTKLHSLERGQFVAAGDEAKIKLGSLEIGRFIAAFLVMLSHYGPYVDRHALIPSQAIFKGLVFPGPLGVQYFFVLSGFVMASAHRRDFGKITAVPRFWWRRICRIYPAYWLALCVPAYYLFGAMTPMLTLHLALLDPWADIEYIPATWSMRYELAFYIMFSLGMLPYVGKPLLAFWFAFTLWSWCGPLVNLFHPGYMMAIYRFNQVYAVRFFSPMEFYFFAGLVGGYLYAGQRLGRRASIVLVLVAVPLWVLNLPVEGWGVIYGTGPMFQLRMAFITASCILGFASLERHRVLRLGKFAGWAGAMSYPLYIFHEPVLTLVDNELPWGQYGLPGLYVRFFILIVAMLGLVALVTFLFDMPVQRGLRRLTRYVAARRAARVTLRGRCRAA